MHLWVQPAFVSGVETSQESNAFDISGNVSTPLQVLYINSLPGGKVTLKPALSPTIESALRQYSKNQSLTCIRTPCIFLK